MRKWPMQDNLSFADKAIVINGIIDVLKWISPLVNPDCGKVEPPVTEKLVGMMAYANGVDWDPQGDGTKSIFMWDGANWIKFV